MAETLLKLTHRQRANRKAARLVAEMGLSAATAFVLRELSAAEKRSHITWWRRVEGAIRHINNRCGSTTSDDSHARSTEERDTGE